MSSQHEPSTPYTSADDLSAPSLQSGENSSSRSGGVKGHISEFAQTAKTQASAAIQPIADNARSMAEEQKSRGAERIGSMAQAVHSAADEIAREVPAAANYVHAAADKLDNAASLLRDNSVEELMQMATDFAEERPVVFAGGAVAVGFLLARFLRSSTAAGESDEE